ncbi:MAG TPA: adenylate/guanylate cyclase domain-containing protein, partial [Dehalococcoidia bacterium]|nr:adenylate/guanylate cyclase domain-containing protein [Dehalococcoidia bacterium]
RLGDERGRAVLREHERITREVLAAYGGTEVKSMGDGFMASFGSVTKAVECAVALQRAFADRDGEPLDVRVGLNAGEPIEEDGDLFGATVILASRIAAKAEGGEILVADTVRGLCSGKGFLFADRGEFRGQGFRGACAGIRSELARIGGSGVLGRRPASQRTLLDPRRRRRRARGYSSRHLRRRSWRPGHPDFRL